MLGDFNREDYVRLLLLNERYASGLRAIKDIIDALDEGRITATIGNDDFDKDNHIYDLNVIIGAIRSNVYGSLGINIPSGK